MGDADVKGGSGISNPYGDGTDAESVGNDESTGSLGGERREGRLWVRGRGFGAIGGGEEELEGRGTKEERRMDEVSCRKVRSCGEGHAEAEGESAGGVGGVSAPELYVVKS